MAALFAVRDGWLIGAFFGNWTENQSVTKRHDFLTFWFPASSGACGKPASVLWRFLEKPGRRCRVFGAYLIYFNCPILVLWILFVTFA